VATGGINPPQVFAADLGRVVVRGTGSLSGELTIARSASGGLDVTVPATPERQAAAFGVVVGGAAFGGYVAEVVAHETGYIIIGMIAGSWAGARLWNRWVHKSIT
jgi:hypothetical protein